ncbi:MAG TPA: hypothetical protein VGH64_08945 [Puia sp.]|jgi:hypothetical protein
MKRKYLVIAGIGLAWVTAAVFFFRYRNRLSGSKSKGKADKKTADGEKHIRNVMKKSKLAL